MISVLARHESWPIDGTFTISRGSRTAAEIVVAEIGEGGRRGRGECVPYPRYGESVDSVLNEIGSLAAALADGLTRTELQHALPAGAARNAIDCALWDLEAKRAGRRIWEVANLPAPEPAVTAFTISVGPADKMRADAEANRARPLLKLKLTGPGDLQRVEAVRQAAPDSRLVVDANEAWTPAICRELFPALGDLGVEMIEQPLPAGEDSILAELDRPVPLCADESCHTRADLPALAGRYDMINIKLDKTGGLTEALALADAAAAAGLGIMIGCMIGTSLAMAPATLLTAGAAIVDLDGPLLLRQDRPDHLSFAENRVHPPTPDLWG
ncbi:MAG: L-Ala-D/L-Glu epimerase [Alphaproteobacteria bacterium]|nr:L-Ala-D/L-Glu epimerase [Alphaproteobacteria bacterium]